MARAFPVQLGGPAGAAAGWPACLAVRASDDEARLRSQLGHDLAKASAASGLASMGVVAYCEPGMLEEGRIKLSLRADGGLDSTVVSEALGGGGHRGASSCIVTEAEFGAWAVEGGGVRGA